MARRLLQGFRYALAGLKLAWQGEINFRIELLCAVLVLIFGAALRLSSIEFAFIILAIGSVLTAEAFNTALEELCDKFQPTHDPHIARIKDLSAAAVLIASIMAVLIGVLVFTPHL